MGRKKVRISEEYRERTSPPPLTSEARENELISLAIDLAEQQLRDGTASSQVITHYLKLGSSKERLEKDILAEQKKLVVAKTEAIESQKKTEELYAEALKAMKAYSGQEDNDDI
jgi:hypothetical protein